MLTLKCRDCGATATFPDGEVVNGQPILDWFIDQGQRCKLCRNPQVRMNRTEAATEEAIGRVDAHADDEWKQMALDCARWCAENFAEFTADEVWQALEKFPQFGTHQPAALGPVFLRAARQGWIANSGRWRKRSLYSRRHRELTIWRSLIFTQNLTLV